MGTVDGGVDCDPPVQLSRGVGFGRWILSQVPLPLYRGALPHRLHGPEHHQQIPPGDPSLQPVDDALDHLTVITKMPPSLTFRGRGQQLNPSPLSIVEDHAT